MGDESKGKTVKVVSGFQQSETDKSTVFILAKILVFDDEGRLIDVKACPAERFEIPVDEAS
jgi:hypothetical protein